MPIQPDLTYPAIRKTIKESVVPGRTESHSFLVWFLKHYYRLDDFESIDTVCDGPDDKGIDGIYVDENLETIDVFQCKLIQNPLRTLGDTPLKEFIGTLAQFADAEKIDDIKSSTSNADLANLLASSDISGKVKNGWAVKGVFLTNIERNQHAIDYIDRTEYLHLFDKQILESSYISVDPTSPIGMPVSFDVFGYDTIQCQVADVKVIFAPLKGSELMLLDGINSSELFAWNVRASLGRTKVNKDIGRSIIDPSEHKNFLLYHNGLTILCEELKKADDKIKVSGYIVVNGCQSLTSLYDNRGKITDELRIMVRLIELPPEHELAEKITHHSNNQNPINARDLQSNSTVQRRLQNEFAEQYAGQIFYRIKRGEPDQAPQVIDNDEAGRLLLAFDLTQPWTCHQSYKILDELHNDIFARPAVDAHRIVAVADIHENIVSHLKEIQLPVLASYRLTQYFLLYLVKEALELDDDGRAFCENPYEFLRQDEGRERLRKSTLPIIKDIIIDLNAEVKDRHDDGTPLDFKRELKSPNAVRELRRSIVTQYQKAVSRGRVNSFGQEWANTL